ncbi:2-phosphosulfolactate phosphatase [Paenibacillus larvae subsp. pulvifaciens]|uniref:Probable 2-phosphosulfolactate phosphatase n=1 Tax=Paenibacillus larvae subsp. pulvifaciens TaxID=1477 RepID=A0A1V0UWC7_9BACL|nr:2-phosphosulfolactate phosphatase [Paenibacillus larvae]ARF69459.1 2-phosphosulfolactate phosphatase [Paenibacillus larvae subsp. pulvifaciens]MCY9510799.1 2-phosphosulfolactate phosphatase [Paenibacillus larvae]MCY9526006.1 2-phosphosulfolactate phosphatase [Paenibacillus larvae]
MKIETIASLNEVGVQELAGKTVIVIDVLRATSCIVTALAGGCREVVPVETVGQAKQAFEEGSLLGGERSCRKIPGFDLGNSPLEYLKETVKDKRIIMTTTNGTKAVQKALKAENVLIGSMLNGTACIRAALQLKKDIVLICAGTQHVFSLEDGLCAGFLLDEADKIEGARQMEIDDLGLALLYGYKQAKSDLTQAFHRCANGRRLHKLGFRQDVFFCCQQNLYLTVPIWREGRLIELLS